MTTDNLIALIVGVLGVIATLVGTAIFEIGKREIKSRFQIACGPLLSEPDGNSVSWQISIRRGRWTTSPLDLRIFSSREDGKVVKLNFVQALPLGCVAYSRIEDRVAYLTAENWIGRSDIVLVAVFDISDRPKFLSYTESVRQYYSDSFVEDHNFRFTIIWKAHRRLALLSLIFTLFFGAIIFNLIYLGVANG